LFHAIVCVVHGIAFIDRKTLSELADGRFSGFSQRRKAILVTEKADHMTRHHRRPGGCGGWVFAEASRQRRPRKKRASKQREQIPTLWVHPNFHDFRRI
jgi:hypothetical protein